MAELVDALVSNTNAARRAGSIPALGTDRGAEKSAPFLYVLIRIADTRELFRARS